MKFDVPSADLFYQILKENGKDEFDKIANELANNFNAARKRWEDEKKAEAEKQRKINERKQAENRAALAISSHLNDLFGDVWPMQQSSDFAKAMIDELNQAADKMKQVDDAMKKVADTVPVVEEKKTPDSKVTVRKGTIDPKSKELQDLLDLIHSVF
jgi:alkylhydroperoxidase/carboxymuconolactone decarboxylase family protein YurZ